MKRLLILLIALMAAGFVACKGAVTETPNPCPGGSCAFDQPGGGDDGGNEPTVGSPASACDDEKAALTTYANVAYGVTVGYPACWSVAEKAAGDSAKKLPAQIEFTRPSATCPVPPLVAVTIVRLAAGENPLAVAGFDDCDLGAVSIGTLSGSSCDLLTEAEREGGIALKELYVLARGGAIYAVVSAVACEDEMAGVERILGHISIR